MIDRPNKLSKLKESSCQFLLKTFDRQRATPVWLLSVNHLVKPLATLRLWWLNDVTEHFSLYNLTWSFTSWEYQKAHPLLLRQKLRRCDRPTSKQYSRTQRKRIEEKNHSYHITNKIDFYLWFWTRWLICVKKPFGWHKDTYLVL